LKSGLDFTAVSEDKFRDFASNAVRLVSIPLCSGSAPPCSVMFGLQVGILAMGCLEFSNVNTVI
jgi:hypothetical protein